MHWRNPIHCRWARGSVPREISSENCGCIKHRTKSFARWLHGTCVEAPPQKIESEDHLFVFSYFPDISTNPEIVSLVLNIQHSIKNAIANLTRYLMRWKRYRSIWKVDKVGSSFVAAEFLTKKTLIIRWFCTGSRSIDTLSINFACWFTQLTSVEQEYLPLLCELLSANTSRWLSE